MRNLTYALFILALATIEVPQAMAQNADLMQCLQDVKTCHQECSGKLQRAANESLQSANDFEKTGKVLKDAAKNQKDLSNLASECIDKYGKIAEGMYKRVAELSKALDVQLKEGNRLREISAKKFEEMSRSVKVFSKCVDAETSVKGIISGGFARYNCSDSKVWHDRVKRESDEAFKKVDESDKETNNILVEYTGLEKILTDSKKASDQGKKTTTTEDRTR